MADAGGVPAADAMPALSAVQRLEQTRERLRAVLTPATKAQAGGERTRGASWEQRLRSVPGVSLLVDVVQAWWQQHPLRAGSLVAREVSRAALRPIARRHPFALVGAALVVGAALAWARPWRWAVKSALFAGLLPQLVSRVVTSLPIEEWLNVLGAFISGAGGHAASDPVAASDAATGPVADASGFGKPVADSADATGLTRAL